MTGHPTTAGGPALDLARRLILHLRDVLRHDSRPSHLETCLDGPAAFQLGEEAQGLVALDAAHVAGLTPWDAGAVPLNQLRAGGVLHAAAEQGRWQSFSLRSCPPPMYWRSWSGTPGSAPTWYGCGSLAKAHGRLSVGLGSYKGYRS